MEPQAHLMSAVKVVAVGCAPAASMRSYTRSASHAWLLMLHAMMTVLKVRASGSMPCGGQRSSASASSVG